MVGEADILLRFRKRLRQLRKEWGYSQERFPLESGLDRSYYGQVERGEQNVTLKNQHRIAHSWTSRCPSYSRACELRQVMQAVGMTLPEFVNWYETELLRVRDAAANPPHIWSLRCRC